MTQPAPILLFVFNRPEHLKKTVESLLKNPLAEKSDLFIYSDAAKKEKDENHVKEVREYIRKIKGTKSLNIIERDNNFGLAESIIDGVTDILRKCESAIILEDDLLLSPYFLNYMNDAMVLYKDEERVASVHGYIYPVKKEMPETFFLKGADCWGWGTWNRAWKIFEKDSKKLLTELQNKNLEYEFDLDGAANNIKMLKNQIEGKVDSWAIRWHASAFLKNMLTLYPGQSLVNNIGNDSFGTHTKSTNIYDTELAVNPVKISKIPVEENLSAREAVKEFFISIKPNFLKRIGKNIKHKLNI
jgi:hypothetical protein